MERFKLPVNKSMFSAIHCVKSAYPTIFRRGFLDEMFVKDTLAIKKRLQQIIFLFFQCEASGPGTLIRTMAAVLLRSCYLLIARF